MCFVTRFGCGALSAGTRASRSKGCCCRRISCPRFPYFPYCFLSPHFIVLFTFRFSILFTKILEWCEGVAGIVLHSVDTSEARKYLSVSPVCFLFAWKKKTKKRETWWKQAFQSRTTLTTKPSRRVAPSERVASGRTVRYERHLPGKPLSLNVRTVGVRIWRPNAP